MTDVSELPVAAQRPADGLRLLVVRGVGWKAVSQVVLQVSRFCVGIVLARLLSPHDYGLAGMVLVFTGLVVVVSDLALGAALVQRRTLREADRSTVFWMCTGAGLFFTLLGVGLSGPAARFYHEPAVRPLFAALSLSFLITSLGTTQRALLMREMNFRSLELRLMAATVLGGVVGITAAANGAGAWAIIGQQLVLAIVSTALLWRFSAWRPSLSFSRASLRDLGGYSGNLIAQRILFALHLNIGGLLIGRVLGAAALGVYSLAYNVMFVPFSQIAMPIGDVLLPAFSRLQDDVERLASSWVRATRLIAAISMPALLGTMVIAPDFVQVVLGNRWSAATPVIRALAWVALLQTLQLLNATVLLALGRTRAFLNYTIFFFAFNLAAFVIGLRWGVVGVAVAYAISSTLVEPVFNVVTTRVLGVSPWVIVRELWGVTQASVGTAVVVLIARSTLFADAPVGARLAALVVLGIAAYALLCALRAPEVFGEVRVVAAACRRRASQR